MLIQSFFSHNVTKIRTSVDSLNREHRNPDSVLVILVTHFKNQHRPHKKGHMKYRQSINMKSLVPHPTAQTAWDIQPRYLLHQKDATGDTVAIFEFPFLSPKIGPIQNGNADSSSFRFRSF